MWTLGYQCVRFYPTVQQIPKGVIVHHDLHSRWWSNPLTIVIDQASGVGALKIPLAEFGVVLFLYCLFVTLSKLINKKVLLGTTLSKLSQCLQSPPSENPEGTCVFASFVMMGKKSFNELTLA